MGVVLHPKKPKGAEPAIQEQVAAQSNVANSMDGNRVKNKDADKSSGERGSQTTGGNDGRTADQAVSQTCPLISRRAVIWGIGGIAALCVVGGMRYAGHTRLRRPPGGQNDSATVLSCIRCQKCTEACPRRVVVPAHAEQGLLGMRVPTLDYNTNYCDFCESENGGRPLCEAVCPTDALELDPAMLNADGTLKEKPVLGIAEIDQRTCLAWRNTGCKFCYDACAEAGYDAIELESGNLYPTVNTDKCVGCGACEAYCVSLKVGSIAEGATERAIIVRYDTDLYGE